VVSNGGIMWCFLKCNALVFSINSTGFSYFDGDKQVLIMLFSASFVCSNDCTDYRVIYIPWCSGEWSISLWLVEWEKLLV